ncbi:K(+)-transporting ATPase subunit F [Clostridium estertheticum]|nr:K(+)-transporting ATPase subunit F [Clostridium estertheticum]WLC86102.1 K(+)-transporting ATPase subunit F [Clostridium estertheticum]
MVILIIMIILLFCYLFYALLNPEKI